MNISAYILEYLKQSGSVKVPAFGTFSLEKSKAVINSENGSILPPSRKIVFNSDYQTSGKELSAFISSKKSIATDAAENELKIQTDFWKKKLQSEKLLEIPELGVLSLENETLHFKGNRLESDHPDFYGLEEIRFSDIKASEKPAVNPSQEKDYRFNRSILWIFLIIIPVLGMLYFAYTQKELLFGKKSINEVSVQTKTKRIEKKIPVKIDSAQIKRQDSINAFKTDSLKKDSVKKAAKTWKPNSKKRKSRWQK